MHIFKKTDYFLFLLLSGAPSEKSIKHKEVSLPAVNCQCFKTNCHCVGLGLLIGLCNEWDGSSDDSAHFLFMLCLLILRIPFLTCGFPSCVQDLLTTVPFPGWLDFFRLLINIWQCDLEDFQLAQYSTVI